MNPLLPLIFATASAASTLVPVRVQGVVKWSVDGDQDRTTIVKAYTLTGELQDHVDSTKEVYSLDVPSGVRIKIWFIANDCQIASLQISSNDQYTPCRPQDITLSSWEYPRSQIFLSMAHSARDVLPFASITSGCLQTSATDEIRSLAQQQLELIAEFARMTGTQDADLVIYKLAELAIAIPEAADDVNRVKGELAANNKTAGIFEGREEYIRLVDRIIRADKGQDASVTETELRSSVLDTGGFLLLRQAALRVYAEKSHPIEGEIATFARREAMRPDSKFVFSSMKLLASSNDVDLEHIVRLAVGGTDPTRLSAAVFALSASGKLTQEDIDTVSFRTQKDENRNVRLECVRLSRVLLRDSRVNKSTHDKLVTAVSKTLDDPDEEVALKSLGTVLGQSQLPSAARTEVDAFLSKAGFLTTTTPSLPDLTLPEEIKAEIVTENGRLLKIRFTIPVLNVGGSIAESGVLIRAVESIGSQFDESPTDAQPRPLQGNGLLKEALPAQARTKTPVIIEITIDAIALKRFSPDSRHRFIVTIDPDNKTSDANRKNNSREVTVTARRPGNRSSAN